MAIAGVVRFGDPRRTDQDLKRMAEAMVVFAGPAQVVRCGPAVGLLQTGDRSARGNTVGDRNQLQRPAVVADASLHDREELARLLGLSSAEARDAPDHELVHRAFGLWGPGMVERLDGAFALAVWDGARNVLHCFRDHAGQRPFFYHRSHDLFAFASMPSILLTLEEIGCRLDEVKLAEILVGCYERTHATVFGGLSRLSGGSRIEADSNGSRVTRYWSVADCPPLRFASDAEVAEEASRLLERSTASRLPAVGTQGVSLSGGLDSSAVACFAARDLLEREGTLVAFHREPPESFTRHAPVNKVLNEHEYVESIARRYRNVEVVSIRQGAGSPLAGLARRIRFCQRPVLRVANHHWFHPLWKAAGERNINVLLAGGAGDLTMSWGGRGELAELARRGRWATLIHLLPHRARWLESSTSGVLWTQVLRPLLYELKVRAATALDRSGPFRELLARSPIHPRLADELRLEERLRDLAWDASGPRQLSQRALRLRHARCYDDAAAEVLTGLGACYGFELSDPFRDRRIFELCFGIPPIQYLSGGADRSLLRRACRGVVPETILGRRFKGAQAVDWAERLEESKALIRDEIEWISRSPLASRILDVGRMRSILDSGRLSRWLESRRRATGPDTRAAYGALMADYSGVLLTGVSTGMFIRWLEEGCP